MSKIDGLAEVLGVTLGGGAEEKLQAFVAEVARWSKRVNLVSVSDSNPLEEVLLADALVLADREIVPSGARLLDVGAGAGAPTLPLLLLRDDVSAVCIEPRGKRATFIRTAGAKLSLSARLDVRGGRVDPDDPAVEGMPFDIALSRATFAPSAWVEIGARLADRVAVLTARGDAPPAPRGFARVAEKHYRLPTHDAPRGVTVYARG